MKRNVVLIHASTGMNLENMQKAERHDHLLYDSLHHEMSRGREAVETENRLVVLRFGHGGW